MTGLLANIGCRRSNVITCSQVASNVSLLTLTFVTTGILFWSQPREIVQKNFMLVCNEDRWAGDELVPDVHRDDAIPFHPNERGRILSCR